MHQNQKPTGIVLGVGRKTSLRFNYAVNFMYRKPFNIEEVKKNYPDKAEMLLKDPVHLWRALNGVELIHKEPTKEEQIRIWNNWNEMGGEMKRKSDIKSIELFGIDNSMHNAQIMSLWNKI